MLLGFAEPGRARVPLVPQHARTTRGFQPLRFAFAGQLPALL
jgi:hypothetical protein